MGLEIIILSEVRQRERQIPYDIICMWNLKKTMTQMNLFMEQKQTQTSKKNKNKNKTMVTKGKMLGEGIVKDFGKVMYTLLYLKWITNKDLLYSTRNSAQYFIMTYIMTLLGFQVVLVLKNPIANAGNTRDAGTILSCKDPLE